IDYIGQHKDCGENSDDHLFDAGRFCSPHDRGKDKRKDNRKRDDREMRQTVRLKLRLHALRRLYKSRIECKDGRLRPMLKLGGLVHRISQRLHGMTSVTHAILLGNRWVPPAFFCSGTTSMSAFTDWTKSDAAKPVFPRMQRASIGTSVAPADKTNLSNASSSSSSRLRFSCLPASARIDARASSKVVMTRIT